MENNDYNVDSEEWDNTIQTVGAAKQTMEDSCEQMRDIVKNSLVGAGMTGEVAERLAEAYDREVLSSSTKFADVVQQQIQTNKDSLDRYNAMQEETATIADRAIM